MHFTSAIKEFHTGLPASIIADMLLLPSLTVLWCLTSDQECQPGASECKRLEKLHPILRDASDGQYRSIFRIWKATGSTGQTLADLCCANEIDTAAIADHLTEFTCSIDRHTKQDAIVMKSPAYRGNGFLDDSLVVDWSR